MNEELRLARDRVYRLKQAEDDKLRATLPDLSEEDLKATLARLEDEDEDGHWSGRCPWKCIPCEIERLIANIEARRRCVEPGENPFFTNYSNFSCPVEEVRAGDVLRQSLPGQQRGWGHCVIVTKVKVETKHTHVWVKKTNTDEPHRSYTYPPKAHLDVNRSSK